jgi:hypothetical protein
MATVPPSLNEVQVLVEGGAEGGGSGVSTVLKLLDYI